MGHEAAPHTLAELGEFALPGIVTYCPRCLRAVAAGGPWISVELESSPVDATTVRALRDADGMDPDEAEGMRDDDVVKGGYGFGLEVCESCAAEFALMVARPSVALVKEWMEAAMLPPKQVM